MSGTTREAGRLRDEQFLAALNLDAARRSYLVVRAAEGLLHEVGVLGVTPRGEQPFAGVNPTLTTEIVEHIESLNEDGLTLLIIEHELETLTELVDRLIVLSDGRVLVADAPGDVMENQEVINAYLSG